MRLASLALLFAITAPASASNFWIPAQEFDKHTNNVMDGALVVDDVTDQQVWLLGDDQQIRIKIGLDDELKQYLDNTYMFQVCALVANYDTGVTNTVISKHYDFSVSRKQSLKSNDYKVLCSKGGSLNNDSLNSAGFKVVSPSQGIVKVRGVLFRGTESSVTASSASSSSSSSSSAMADYEYSRALGYLWGDGGISTDGNFLFFRKNTNSTSEHFGSVASSYFGSALSMNSQNSRYTVQLDGITPANFLAQGVPLADIPDKPAFLTSVVETEGAVLVGRIADDPSLERCAYIKTLVDDLNPQCAATTCTSASCQTANCGFIANSKKRGVPYQAGSSCAVYLSGDASDWRALFSSDDFHFVKTDRTPGGEPTRNAPGSRPSYTN